MHIIKSINDYAKTSFEEQIASHLSKKLESTSCAEKIKNKQFLLMHVQPIHDFIIYSTRI